MHIQGQGNVIKQEHDEETILYRDIDQKSASVLELTKEVAKLLANQDESIQSLENNSDISTEQIIAGIKLLAEARMSDSKKHTTRGSLAGACITGLSGLAIAGPIGLILGAVSGVAVGGYAGQTLTDLSRRNILMDLNNLEKLNSFQINENGDLICSVEVFQVEKKSAIFKATWTPFKRSDARSKLKHCWMNSMMQSLSYDEPNPERFEKLQSNVNPKIFLPFVLGNDLFKSCKREIDSVEWSWREGAWKIERGEQVDGQGWQYSFERYGKDWFPKAFPTSFVRRRKWVQQIIGRNKKTFSDQKVVKDESSELGLIDAERDIRELDESLLRFEEIAKLNDVNVERLTSHGEAILNSLKKMQHLEETAKYAERINRATNIFGLLKNLSTRPQITRQPPKLKAAVETEPEMKDNDRTNVGLLQRNVDVNLKRIKKMNKEIEEQNVSLDNVGDSIDKTSANFSIAKLKMKRTMLEDLNFFND